MREDMFWPIGVGFEGLDEGETIGMDAIDMEEIKVWVRSAAGDGGEVMETSWVWKSEEIG